jgi:predicted aminopeptidase
MRSTDELHRRHLDYLAARALLGQAIVDAERSCRRLEDRLADADRRATLAGDRLRVPGFVYIEPDVRRSAQRSSTTISVAHATAS